MVDVCNVLVQDRGGAPKPTGALGELLVPLPVYEPLSDRALEAKLKQAEPATTTRPGGTDTARVPTASMNEGSSLLAPRWGRK